MSKWDEYKTYKNWKYQNERELREKYEACELERRCQYDNPSFDDFCMGIWQRME